MLDANNTDYYNVSGMQINDPSINEDGTMIYGQYYPLRNLSMLARLICSSALRSAHEQIRIGLRVERHVHG